MYTIRVTISCIYYFVFTISFYFMHLINLSGYLAASVQIKPVVLWRPPSTCSCLDTSRPPILKQWRPHAPAYSADCLRCCQPVARRSFVDYSSRRRRPADLPVSVHHATPVGHSPLTIHATFNNLHCVAIKTGTRRYFGTI